MSRNPSSSLSNPSPSKPRHHHQSSPPTLRNPPLASPPSLPQIVLQQVENGWNCLSQSKGILSVSIPDSYKSQVLGPQPFPRLGNLYEQKDTAVNTDDDTRCERSQSCDKVQAPRTGSRSQHDQHVSPQGNGRPSSAPPQQYQNSSSKRMHTHLERSKIDFHTVPDNFPVRRFSSGSFTTIPKNDSIQAIHQRQPNRSTNNNNNDSRSSMSSSQWSNGGLDDEVGSTSEVDEVPSGSQSVLIDKGIKLLKTGRDIMQQNRSTTLKTTSLQDVANTLHDLVMGQLHALQKENEVLRVENSKLKNKTTSAVTSIVKTSRATLQRVTASPVQTLHLPGIPSNLSGSRNRVEKNGGSGSGVDVLHRIEALEESVASLVDQTSQIQERLYHQEIRYEETLGKVKDVLANLTTLYSKLVSPGEKISAHRSSQVKIDTVFTQLNETAEHLATITSSNSSSNHRRVQFKGILKK